MTGSKSLANPTLAPMKMLWPGAVSQGVDWNVVTSV